MTLHTPPSDDPTEVLRWADARFGCGLVVTASFGDATLVHLFVAGAIPDVDIVLLDTGYLFAETEWFADDLRRRFNLNLRTIHPLPGTDRDVWRNDKTNACCAARKVEPLNRALAGKSAWVTAFDAPIHRRARSGRPRRPDAASSRSTRWPPGTMTTCRAIRLGTTFRPTHWLTVATPPSDAGHAPLVADGADDRSGRWAGQGKTECGLHLEVREPNLP